MSSRRPHLDSAPSAGLLPAELTSFVGRKAELAQAKRLLTNARLVTLTGFGGVGKTRLALRVAADLRRTFPDGVRLVTLAPLTEPELLARTLTEALGIRDQSARPPLDALIEHLHGQHVLLVLDNCEHLVDPVGALAGTLLRAVPQLHILATSRTDLNVQGEHVYKVPPLSVPDDEAVESGTAVLSESEAMRLMVARAAAAGFEVTDDVLPDLARLCSRLDGIPLAIELAAVRLKTMSVREILRRLDDRFRLLTGGDTRIVPLHHQTLRAAVDWSYDLCTEAEQVLWARLSVFVGSFDVTAVDAVCTDTRVTADQVLDLLDSLARQSILAADTTGSHTRYYLIETLRQFGRERLDRLGDTQLLRRRHRDHYRDLVIETSMTWLGPREIELLNMTGKDLPNIRAAMDYSLSEPDGGHDALLIASALARGRFWFFTGTIGEGRMWLRRCVLLTEQQPDEAHLAALAAAAWLALCQGDPNAAKIRARYLGLAPRFPDGPAATAIRFAEGAHYWLVDPQPRSVGLLRQARDEFHALGSPGDAWMADLFATLAAAFIADRDTALHASSTLVAGSASTGAAWSISWSWWAAGVAELRFGDPRKAIRMLRDALAQQQEIQDLWGPVWSVEGLAWAAAEVGEYDQAARLLGAADAMRAELGGLSIENLRPLAAMRAHAERVARERLGAHAYSTAYGCGTALSWSDAINTALRRQTAGPWGETSAAATPVTVLSTRELQIARLVAEGLSNVDIASKLVISTRTVETHVSNILGKLGFDNRRQITTWVAEIDRSVREHPADGPGSR